MSLSILLFLYSIQEQIAVKKTVAELLKRDSRRATILDLPMEIFDFIFTFLDHMDIYRLGETGNERLKNISDIYAQIGMLQGPVSYTHLTLPTNREV